MLSSRMVQSGLSSPVRTRPSSTCSLKAITRSVSLPPLVTRPSPERMRLPLPPATLRAGGRISAGMISTVHTPLPICEAIAPKVCPQRCAPSPESLTISTICSLNVTAVFPPCSARGGLARARARLDGGIAWSRSSCYLRRRECARSCVPADRSRRTCRRRLRRHRRRRNHGFSDSSSCCARPCGRRPSLRSRSRRR